MVKLTVIYEGSLDTVAVHEASGQRLHTTAPLDQMGKGNTFSPTDLVAAALASCIATVIGMYADRKKWDLKGMRLQIEKEMSKTAPRRISKLKTEIWFPIELPEEEKEKVKKVAETCPVYQSLHPEVEHPLAFHWK